MKDRTVRRVLGALGVVTVAVGGVLVIDGLFHPAELISVGIWLLLPPILSDVIAMPVVAVLAWLIGRRLPTSWRVPISAAMAMTGFVALIGWPFIGGFGRTPGNPSSLDRDYTAGAAAVVGSIWAVCLVAGAIRSRRARARDLVADGKPDAR